VNAPRSKGAALRRILRSDAHPLRHPFILLLSSEVEHATRHAWVNGQVTCRNRNGRVGVRDAGRHTER
jgi:hypothetical protein